ncbi:Tat pathway signal protein [Streptomyces sp. NPDC059866]|uniref:Tat pathway signal protein n=1 Tax=Streptomyces sp. NPDC059866 TaxID=3346978 RepID=UPI00364C2766
MVDNVLLAARMESAGLKQHELAEALNQRIASFTGTHGTLQDRHIRNWLTGKTRWPQARQRRALEEEFGCPVEELGFIRPKRRTTAPPAPSEDPVRRRTFASTAAGLVAAAALPAASASAYRRIGMSDADRLETAFTELVAADNAHGGTISLETRALAFAHHAMELQSVAAASQRVRARLYYLAAAFTGTALWAAIDDYAPDRAARHLDRAMTLAGLSGHADIMLRLWGHAAILTHQQQRNHDALAAVQAGRASAACRRDPLYRSLAAARLAGIQAIVGERSSALRSVEHARSAFDAADPDERRPAWTGFFDAAELTGLAALTYSRLGMHDEAEACLHRTLSRLRPDFTRNAVYYRTHLALAQLRQDDVEQAYTTALSVLPAKASGSLTGRTARLLDGFTRELQAAAPATRWTADWTEQYVGGTLS